MIAKLILEAERAGNPAAICRRANIAPNLFYPWKAKFFEAGVAALKDLKREAKNKDQDKIQPESKIQRFKSALCELSIELQLLKKKRELGLHGSLKKRHLPTEVRKSLCNIIDEARRAESSVSVAALCFALELNPRAYCRWKTAKNLGCRHGGGGGLNKVTPTEIKKVLSTVHKFPHHGCRRIA